MLNYKIFFSHQLSCEIKHLLSQIDVLDKLPKEEISIIEGCIKRYDAAPEKMLVEDLCAMDKLTEERISDLLKQRLERGDSYTFAGDVLISLNSNELPAQFLRSVSIMILCLSQIQIYIDKRIKIVTTFVCFAFIT